MKTKTQPNNARFAWQKKPLMMGALKPWLLDRGSLTKRLQQRYQAQNFAVLPCLQTYQKPLLDEGAALHMFAHQRAYIREVLLLGNEQAVVFAHSVLPRGAFRGNVFGLERLGNKPLGALLFANPKVKRTALQYKKLMPHHVLYQHALKFKSQSQQQYQDANAGIKPPSFLWARRSVFTLNCANIMVTEVFLPALNLK